MAPFIRFHFKSLFSTTHIFILIIYFSFSWFLADPAMNPTAIYDSHELTLNYDIILMSFVFLNFMLFIVSHFKQEFKKRRWETNSSRLSNREIFWGLVLSYVLFFLLGFVIPAYGTAFLQQLLYSSNTIEFEVYVLKSLCGLVGYSIPWIVITLWLFRRFQNDFVVLVLFVLCYGIAFFLQLFSGGVFFDQFWLLSITLESPDSFYSIATRFTAWLLVLFCSYRIGNYLAKDLYRFDLVEQYKNGLLAKLAEKVRAYLSMHHLRMMGLASQKLLILFTFLGLVFIIILIRNQDGDLVVLAKTYLGAFLPLLFSFNQYYLIQLDREAGMTHNNFLRKLSYSRIIFNRWLLLLIPQLGIVIIFTLLISILVTQLSISFVVYVLLLNIFCSLLNLFFAVRTRRNSTANLVLTLYVYLQLREEVQTFFVSSGWLNKFNIFYAVLQENEIIQFCHWSIVLSLILLLGGLTIMHLKKINYVELAFS